MTKEHTPTSTPLAAEKWQTEFAQSLFKGLSESLTTSLTVNHPAEQQQRFAIYQNNVFYSLSNALADLYPTIKKLVGDEFFNGTANAYIRERPPKQAAMANFGWDFAEFLSLFEHTQNMPYLSDTAHLELLRHQAYHAANAIALDKNDFINVDPKNFENAQVKLHPSVGLIKSAFPVFSIWQSNQDSMPPAKASDHQQINLDEPQWIIVVRLNYEVLTFNIDYGTYLFYQNLLNKLSVRESANESRTKHPDVDISSAIILGITNGFFTHLIT